MKRALVAVAAVAVCLAGLSACQVGVKMWTPCAPAADGNLSGLDGEYVLWCRGGEWQPIMTVQEYLALRRGERPTIAPLPVNCAARGPGVDLHGCDLSGANLTDRSLAGANLAGARGTDVVLVRTDLSGADLRGVSFTGVLSGANLSGANLAGASLPGTWVNDANMSGANLTGANLAGVWLQGLNLAGANLTDANLNGAFSGPFIVWSGPRPRDLSGAVLTGAIWSNTTCPNGVVQSTPCA